MAEPAGLDVRGMAVRYGQHRALKGVDLRVDAGEVVVILGANGAGKTSLLGAIAGLVHSEATAQVRLAGQLLSGLPPHRIVEAGLALVPEGRALFGDLSVRENLLLGSFAQRARSSQAESLERVLALFPRLAERSAQQARTMSGGEQQMVAIGRALMSAPRILMLDEPSLGLSPLLCSELFRKLRAVRESGVGILLVEQNARQSLAIADRAYLLENGAIVGHGPAAELARDPAVQAAYLGGAVGPAVALPKASAPPPAPALPSRAVAPASAAATATTTTTTTTSADALLPVRVADLVRLATQRQADDLVAQRSAPANAALADAIAGIESAARLRSAAPTPVLAPGLEVWRRPGLEIYRRHGDGTLHKED